MFKLKKIEQDLPNQQNTNASLQTNREKSHIASKCDEFQKSRVLLRHSAEKRRLFKLQNRKNYAYSVHKDKLRRGDQTVEVPESLGQKKNYQNSKIQLNKVSGLNRLVQKSRSYNLKIKIQPKPSQINQSSRIILLDWLSEVSIELGISKQALYQSACYLDKLVSQFQICRQQYQAMGLSCLFLSHKLDSFKTFSFVVASNLIQESRSSQWFVEQEKKILIMLRFRLKVFTIWEEMNFLLFGFQIYFKRQISLMRNWDLYRNKVLWVTSGISLKQTNTLNQNNQKEMFIQELVALGYIVENRLKLFCQTLLNQTVSQNLIILQAKMATWSKFECSCQSRYNPEIYHPELKLFASLS